jgi:hypothetical protein
MEPWRERHPDAVLPPPDPSAVDFGAPQEFIPQKQQALGRARLLAAAALGGGLTLLGWYVASGFSGH